MVDDVTSNMTHDRLAKRRKLESAADVQAHQVSGQEALTTFANSLKQLIPKARDTTKPDGFSFILVSHARPPGEVGGLVIESDW